MFNLATIGFRKYTFHFNMCHMFSEQLIKLNGYFTKQLTARKFLPIKDFQLQAFKIVSEENKNCFINSCTGSGKTLAYLLPIMNRIFEEKQKIVKQNQQQKNIEYQNNQRHGALIFTLNKQLASQIYKEVRLLDIQNKLNAYRIGPISHFAAVIELLNKKQKTSQEQEQIADAVQNNIVRCVNWKKTDIMIATPQMFYNIMTQLIHNKSSPINPKYIVIDQADLLLEIDKNLAKYMQKIIDLLKGDIPKTTKSQKNNFSQQKIQKSDQIQYILSSSSFPKKINKIKCEQYLQKYFRPIKTVTGINKHRLPERVDLKYIQIQAKSQALPGGQDLEVEKEKLFYLAKILCDPEKKGNRFIVFCANKKTVQKVSAFLLDKLKLTSVQYYAGLPSDQRSRNLYKFMNEKVDILVSTDLGSRGLDFTRPIHTVIEYDMAQNIVNFINRAGRTARNQLPGQIITFVEDKNKIFFDHLAQKNSNDQEFDDLFSRKRSYNKLILKYLKQQKI